MNLKIARRLQPCLLAAAGLVLGASAALAQGGAKPPSDVVFLAELIVLMLVGRLLGEAMHRIGQPSVMGQLLAGILLGPSVLGWIWPDLQHWIFPDAKEQKAMLDGMSQFAVLLILLMTGMETDLKIVKESSRASIFSISAANAAFSCRSFFLVLALSGSVFVAICCATICCILSISPCCWMRRNAAAFCSSCRSSSCLRTRP